MQTVHGRAQREVAEYVHRIAYPQHRGECNASQARRPKEAARWRSLAGLGQRPMLGSGSRVAPRIDGPGLAFRPAMGKMPMIIGSMNSNKLATMSKLSRIIRQRSSVDVAMAAEKIEASRSLRELR